MARLTHLQVINKVLSRLGAASVASSGEGTYAAMVSDLVDQARKQVEYSLNLRWHDLRLEVDITLVPSTQRYSLAGLGEEYLIQSVTNETRSRGEIYRASEERWISLWPSTQAGTPQWYRLCAYDGSGDPQIDFWPVPDVGDSVKVWAWRGQGTAGDGEQLLVPSEPVILGAYLLALEERGEDGGDLYAQRRYLAALNNAQAQESIVGEDTMSNDWVVE